VRVGDVLRRRRAIYLYARPVCISRPSQFPGRSVDISVYIYMYVCICIYISPVSAVKAGTRRGRAIDTYLSLFAFTRPREKARRRYQDGREKAKRR
jgi:hypothetical protein